MAKPKKVRVNCDQCQMLSINGVACHERGCPNMGARWDAEFGIWIKQRKCFVCGYKVNEDDPCCNAPSDEYDHDADEEMFGGAE